MDITQITDHVNRALDRVVLQFKNSGLLKGLIGALSTEVQVLEDGLWGLLQAVRSVSTATGTTLEKIGALVGAPVRGTRSDAQLRNRINAQILANRGSGEAANIYAVSKLIVSAWNISGQPKITEYYPGEYEIACTPRHTIVNSDAEARELAAILADISAAGVHAIVISQQIAEASAFSFAGGTGLGFGAGDFTAAYDK